LVATAKETVTKTGTGIAVAIAAASSNGDALATAENSMSPHSGLQADSIVGGAVESTFLSFACGGAVDERRGSAAGELRRIPSWFGWGHEAQS